MPQPMTPELSEAIEQWGLGEMLHSATLSDALLGLIATDADCAARIYQKLSVLPLPKTLMIEVWAVGANGDRVRVGKFGRRR